MDWLLDSDPAIRWQVLRDLSDEPFEADRARVGREGWGAQLLALQQPDGTWAGAAWNRGWNSTMHVLTLLRLFGLDPASPESRRAVERVRENVTWKDCGPPEIHHHRFFEGETEPCINGQVAAAGAYFGEDVRGLIDRLLGEQLADGGWNCEVSTRSSFNTTICVLEALIEFEKAGGKGATEARLRGQNYLLERGLMKRLSTGERIDKDRKGGADWTHFAFPGWWHYDVLRGLDDLRDAGVTPDPRIDDALDAVRSRRDANGHWRAEAHYPGVMPVEIDEDRWVSLRALRVLRWASR